MMLTVIAVSLAGIVLQGAVTPAVSQGANCGLP